MMNQISFPKNKTRNDALQNTFIMRNQTTLGLIKDPNACDFNNMYMKLQYPNNTNILTNFEKETVFRNSVSLFGHDSYYHRVSDAMDLRNQ